MQTEEAIFAKLLEESIHAALLLLALRYVWKAWRRDVQNWQRSAEQRFASLQRAVEKCEADRAELRRQINDMRTESTQ